MRLHLSILKSFRGCSLDQDVSRRKKNSYREIFFEQLEERVVLSSAPLVPILASFDPMPADQYALIETPLHDDDLVSPVANFDFGSNGGSHSAQTPVPSRTEIVFLDSAVENYTSLIAGMSGYMELVILGIGLDGVEQISDYLSGRSDIDAIHILSHGDVGRVLLGTAALTSESLSMYSEDLASWASSPTPHRWNASCLPSLLTNTTTMESAPRFPRHKTCDITPEGPLWLESSCGTRPFMK